MVQYAASILNSESPFMQVFLCSCICPALIIIGGQRRVGIKNYAVDAIYMAVHMILNTLILYMVYAKKILRSILESNLTKNIWRNKSMNFQPYTIGGLQ